MGIWTFHATNALLDLAPVPEVVALAYDMPLVVIAVVAALIALAIVLIVRARRKNKAKQENKK